LGASRSDLLAGFVLLLAAIFAGLLFDLEIFLAAMHATPHRQKDVVPGSLPPGGVQNDGGKTAGTDAARVVP
jgi:hypothetical protein